MEYRAIDEKTVTSDDSQMVQLRKNPVRVKRVYSTYVRNKRLSRYKYALTSLAPFKSQKCTELSVQNVGLFSFVTFSWVVKYLWYSFRNNINLMIPPCSKTEQSLLNSGRLDTLLKDKIVEKGHGIPMIHVIWEFIKTRTIFACILFFLSTIMSLIGIVFIIPEILENPQNNIIYIILLVIIELLAYFLHSWSNAVSLRTSIRIRAACFSSLFRQILLTSLTYKLSSWQIVSFLLPEGQQIHELIIAIPYLICTPVIILSCIGFAGYELNLWGYMSVIVILIFFPILYIVTLISKNLLFKATIFSIKRIKLLEDFIINNMYVKYFKKENYLKEKITSIRKCELMHMRSIGFFDNFCVTFIQNQPVLSLACLFIAFHLNEMPTEIDKKISFIAQIAAVCILILVHLKNSFDNFWSALNNFTKGLVSLQKLKEILILESIEKTTLKPPSELAIVLMDATFQTVKYNNETELKSDKTTQSKPSTEYCTQNVLNKINLRIRKGSLVGICGAPGSGKTSLLLAIMGLLKKTETSKRLIDGDFAYVSQEPIIFNKSLRENILFGNELESAPYYRVLKHCLLTNEIEMEKEQTVIDSKLLMLEERQRIALARALYADKDIYLLDNPLSALHDKKLMDIFDNCVLKSLSDKTRILVTNKIDLLEQCDTVYVMEQGTITFSGQFETLMTNDEAKIIINNLRQQSVTQSDKFHPFGTTGDDPSCPKNVGHISSDYSLFNSVESLNADSIDGIQTTEDYSDHTNSLWTVIKMYLKNFKNCQSIFGLLMSIGNGFFLSLLPVFFIYSLNNPEHMFFYLIAYFSLFTIMLLLSTVVNYFFNKKMFSSAAHFHNDLVNKICNASVSFFQTKSLGIISTVSLHLHFTDNEIPRLIYGMILGVFLILSSFGIITLISYWYTIPFIIIITLITLPMYFVRNALLNFNLYKLDIINSLYQHVVTILIARPIIQAYNRIDEFTQKLYEDYDKYITCTYVMNAAKGWLILIVQCLSVIFLACICFMTCQLLGSDYFCKIINVTEEREITCLALAVVCVYQICFALQKSSMLFIDSSIAFDTLSLVEHFKQGIQEEVNDSSENLSIDNLYGIEFKNVTMSSIYYKENLLEDITFNIQPKQKMGFIGLTSLEVKAILSALYRLNDIDKGTITIDGQDIMNISIPKLRSIITVVPSESHMFDDTIKNVLNPIDKFSQEELIAALNIFGIWNRIATAPMIFDSPVMNLTQNERQLLVLTQAYLQQTPIIIIEDFASGSLIDIILKRYLKELFSNSTIIVFANDIDCLNCCSRTTVVENGKVVVVDKIEKIITNYINTHLRRMDYMENVPETCV